MHTRRVKHEWGGRKKKREKEVQGGWSARSATRVRSEMGGAGSNDGGGITSPEEKWGRGGGSWIVGMGVGSSSVVVGVGGGRGEGEVGGFVVIVQSCSSRPPSSSSS